MTPPKRTIDLNADLGEGFGNDELLLDLVTSASVSCGAHAGDVADIRRTLRAAVERGVVVGAHPGYADRAGFGRRDQNLDASAVETLILKQVRQLAALAANFGLDLRFVKPHGALYNQAQREAPVAEGVISAALKLGLPVLGQPGSLLEALASPAGVHCFAEGFPDRRYLADGRLMPRTDPCAILKNSGEIEAQVVELARRGLDTLCIHGDDPRAVENARHVRSWLERHGFVVKGFL